MADWEGRDLSSAVDSAGVEEGEDERDVHLLLPPSSASVVPSVLLVRPLAAARSMRSSSLSSSFCVRRLGEVERGNVSCSIPLWCAAVGTHRATSRSAASSMALSSWGERSWLTRATFLICLARCPKRSVLSVSS